MNKSILVFILFLFLINSISSHAQKITLPEMYKLIPMSIEGTESFLEKKRFHYEDSQLVEEDRITNFSYEQTEKNKRTYITVSKHTIGNVNYSVSYNTNVKEEYIKFKADLKLAGFKVVNTSYGQDGNIGFTYEKPSNDQYYLIVTLSRSTKDGNLYMIELIDLYKQKQAHGG